MTDAAAAAGPEATDTSRISIRLPHNLLVLPPTAAFVGLAIGMSRGGSRARLRFLAENAHRPPKTVQGWYFYTKTRNYRVFYAACKTGAHYALGLGGAVAAYCVLDESVGWGREQVQGLAEGARERQRQRRRWRVGGERGAELYGGEEEEGDERWSGWRAGPVHWGDGAMAGMIMGAGVGFAFSLPRPLFVRSLLLGSLLGGSTSALQVMQGKVGRLRDEQAREAAVNAEAEVAAEAGAGLGAIATHGHAAPIPAGPERGGGIIQPASVDRPAQPSPPVAATSTFDADTGGQTQGAQSSWTSWIPGWGR